MRKTNNSAYSRIDSFQDLRAEIDRLELKSRIARAKMGMDFYNLRQSFSLTNLAGDLLREFGLGRISDIMDSIFKNRST